VAPPPFDPPNKPALEREFSRLCLVLPPPSRVGHRQARRAAISAGRRPPRHRKIPRGGGSLHSVSRLVTGSIRPS